MGSCSHGSGQSKEGLPLVTFFAGCCFYCTCLLLHSNKMTSINSRMTWMTRISIILYEFLFDVDPSFSGWVLMNGRQPVTGILSVPLISIDCI